MGKQKLDRKELLKGLKIIRLAGVDMVEIDRRTLIPLDRYLLNRTLEKIKIRW